MPSGDLVLSGIAWTVLGIVIAIAAPLKGRPFLP